MSVIPTIEELQKVLPKPCCHDPVVVDLTHGRGEFRHFYCLRCGSHLWKGKQYSKREGDAWVNEVDA